MIETLLFVVIILLAAILLTVAYILLHVAAGKTVADQNKPKKRAPKPAASGQISPEDKKILDEMEKYSGGVKK